MSIFITSDIHFGHKNILRFNPDTRPFNNVGEMDETIINNWNHKIKPTDTVYNLGDFSFLKEKETFNILRRLNGKHHLILGNHDKLFKKESVKDYCLINGLLESISTYQEIYYNKEFICLFHYSLRVWNKSHYGSYMLYGHSHGSLPGIGRSMDIGIDASELQSDCAPFALDDVIKYLKTKDIHELDHHKRREV